MISFEQHGQMKIWIWVFSGLIQTPKHNIILSVHQKSPPFYDSFNAQGFFFPLKKSLSSDLYLTHQKCENICSPKVCHLHNIKFLIHSSGRIWKLDECLIVSQYSEDVLFYNELSLACFKLKVEKQERSLANEMLKLLYMSCFLLLPD